MKLNNWTLNFFEDEENKAFLTNVKEKYLNLLVMISYCGFGFVNVIIILEIILKWDAKGEIWVFKQVFLGLMVLLAIALQIIRRKGSKLLFQILMQIICASFGAQAYCWLFKQYLNYHNEQGSLINNGIIEKESLQINVGLTNTLIQLHTTVLILGLQKWYIIALQQGACLTINFVIMHSYQSFSSIKQFPFQYIIFPLVAVFNIFQSYYNEKTLREGFDSSYNMNQNLENQKRILTQIIPTGIAIFKKKQETANDIDFQNIFLNKALMCQFGKDQCGSGELVFLINLLSNKQFAMRSNTFHKFSITPTKHQNQSEILTNLMSNLIISGKINSKGFTEEEPSPMLPDSSKQAKHGNQSFSDYLKAKANKLRRKNHFLSTCGWYNLEVQNSIETGKVWFEINVGRIEWEGNEAMLACFQNVGSFKEVCEYKNKILSSISHNLKTPLNSVSANIEMLKELNQDQNLKKQIKTVLISNNILKNTVNDILDLAKIMQGKLKIEVHTVELRHVLKDIKRLAKGQASLKGLQFSMEISKGVNEQQVINTDPERLMQILYNLIENAIKFTSKGFIKICVNSKAKNGQKMLEFVVEDSGIGISPENIPKLFQMQQPCNKNDNSINIHGISVGLVISQSIALMLTEGMNNEEERGIKVKSEQMKGSQFSFCIPFDITPFLSNDDNASFEQDINSPRAKDSPIKRKSLKLIPERAYNDFEIFSIMKNESKNTEKKENENREDSISEQHSRVNSPKTRACMMLSKIKWNNEETNEVLKFKTLIVDDDAFCIDVAKMLLAKNQIATQEIATNGFDAVEKVKLAIEEKKQFDIILMDCNMPLMNGFEATRNIIELQKQINSPLQIIGMTANVGTATEDECKKCGMSYQLKKPVTFNEFTKVLTEITTKKRQGELIKSNLKTCF